MALVVHSGTSSPFQASQSTLLIRPCSLPLPQRRRHFCRRTIVRASAADGSSDFSWRKVSISLQRGSERAFSNLREFLRKEIGFDVENVGHQSTRIFNIVQDATRKGREAVDRFRMEKVPSFVDWNRWENWKDIQKWESNRIWALLLYIAIVTIFGQRIYGTIRNHLYQRSRKELTEAYMEALIPEPSPVNIRKVKKSLWRKKLPKGLIVKKFIEGPGGTLVQDKSYVGEDAWEDDLEPSSQVMSKIEQDTMLSLEEKKELKEKLGIKDGESETNWRQRLIAWKEILRNDKLAEQIDSMNAKYVVDFDMQEQSYTQSSRALWISKRWWRYRPKLPYTYFLNKLNSSEVAAVVFSEDLKKLYVTMKEGFPLEYIVDIPLDPYLFEVVSSSGVEVDLLQKWQMHYLLKVVIALAPGLLILYLIRESVTLLNITSQRYLYKRYNQLFDMAYAENFILPEENTEEAKSMLKEVVLGGDVWDLLDEIMIYMNNPMQYYEKQVQFVRGILLSGPPGTGKTLFARTLAKESGLPFVFASGAEFTDSEKSGAARINQLFSIARRNNLIHQLRLPLLYLWDEIDAIAGRHARKDPRRRATFEALLTQLDGEKEKTGVDRFSLRQAVIFLCATNRPDELDPAFVQPGRIDRRLYIGLPDAKQRVQIFGVHSAGKKFSEDVEFEKLVFRTVGYSGADIRNLVNEAAIMSVRKGHSMITQKDIIDVLDKQLLEGMGVLLTEEEQLKCEESVSIETKRLLAVHEAGHVLLAHLFPRFDWHAFSQLLPGGKETAISVFYPREDMVDQGYTTFGYMKMQMVVAHGGRCAERIVFGDDVSDGGRDDLEKITKIAREMVISPRNSRLGLTTLVKRIGMMDRPDSYDGELIKFKWDDPHVIPADMTLEVSELFTRELTRFIDETEEIAMNGLVQNKHILDMLARELLEKSRITGLEVEERMKQYFPVMLEDLAVPFQVNIEKEGPLPVNDRLELSTTGCVSCTASSVLSIHNQFRFCESGIITLDKLLEATYMVFEKM
ncbi:hypothetical protein J5N97_010608 [Dioscorea zingiberensis]|uniref:AAA+ ATPase domain-containing protein n=1 Tax=Dioscorea zingiberensis TaxID=325984 RepID=A0A9D5HMT9_9LILI|nr:hypothetical protein J5N97_010608 [Dioscorea zingiberensis]